MITEKPETFQVCPICEKQGILSAMEGREGNDFIKCAVHGIISLKYFHDIFIDLSWAKSISLTQCRVDGQILAA